MQYSLEKLLHQTSMKTNPLYQKICSFNEQLLLEEGGIEHKTLEDKRFDLEEDGEFFQEQFGKYINSSKPHETVFLDYDLNNGAHATAIFTGPKFWHYDANFGAVSFPTLDALAKSMTLRIQDLSKNEGLTSLRIRRFKRASEEV